ncbi:hypothetical protein FKM82_004263 [Ascaphus truei]
MSFRALLHGNKMIRSITREMAPCYVTVLVMEMIKYRLESSTKSLPCCSVSVSLSLTLPSSTSNSPARPVIRKTGQ